MKQINKVFFLLLFFQSPQLYVRVAGAAAQDWAATHHGPPPTLTFRLVEAPSGFILNSSPCQCDRGRPIGRLFPFTFASKACLGSLSWGILLTWPNQLSWDLAIWRSSGSMFRDFRISELRAFTNNATPSIFRKNLISDARTFDRILSVITQDSGA